MSMTKRFTAFVLALIMMLGCVTVTGFAAGTKNATFTIKMGKVVNGAWTETQEVNPGDDVVARVFLTTDFYAAPERLEFFYDANFYEDNYEDMDVLETINPYYLNKGYYEPLVKTKLAGNNSAIATRTNRDITAEQQARYNWIYLVTDYDDEAECEIFDGSEYLFDIELKVKNNATGSGYFTVLPEVAANNNDDLIHNLNLIIGNPGEKIYEASSDMYLEDVNISVSPDAEGDFMEIAESENKLVITTKFFRKDGSEWVETEKAKRGETLKARVYLDSAYPTNSGELMFFYDNTFFTNDYGTGENSLTLNSAADSFAVANGVEGWFYTSDSTGAQAKAAKMVREGYISQSDIDNNDYFYIIYEFGTGKNNAPAFDDDNEGADSVVDNDLWFCEFELTVADDAEDEGDLVVNPATIATEDTPFGAVNVPKGYENSFNTFGMWLWDAEVVLNSTPVSLESKVTFKANGGLIEGQASKVIEDYIGATYTVPTATKDGSTFAGWFVEGDASETIVTPVATIPYDEITYVAKWTDNVTVVFKDSDDATITYYTKTGAVGSAFPEIDNPEKEGFGFAGWSLTANGPIAALPSTYEDDAVYYAVWEENSYPVTYTINNEVTGDTIVRERYVAYGDEIPTDGIYDVPNGYNFDGWYTDANYGTPFVAGTTMPASTQALYAKLTAKEYTVTFDLNGGNINGDENDVEVPTPYMGTINAPADPVKDHNTFMGWSPALQTGAVLDEPADRTYVATWESDPYTITYYKSEDDKTAGTAYETGEYKPGVTVDSVADPHIDGQTFTGWKYYDETGAEISFTGTMPENDVVAVAQYTPIVYTLTINYVDGTGATVADAYTASLAYGDTYSVTSPEVEGMSPDKAVVSGTVEYVPDEFEEPETEITVTVVYTPKDYTITWNLDGGKVGENAGPIVDTYAFGATNITEPAPAKEGYDFAGWDAQVPATMPAENLEFTAQWTALEYPVTFKLEGGKYNDSTNDVINQVAFDSDISPLDPDPTRDGYTFQGWAETPSSSKLDTLGKMDDVNGKTFYALWLADNASYYIDIFYMGTDGQYPATASETKAGEDGKVTGDHVTTDNTIGAKDGFTFDDAAANVLEGDIPATGTLRLQVYYKRDQHTVKFIADGATVSENTLYFEEAITQPDAADLEKEGYDFLGWTTVENGTTPETVADKMGTSDLTYYAVYEIHKWTLTINYVDEDNAPVANPYGPEEYEYKEAYSQLSPVVTGYTLADADQATVSGNMPDNDVTVTVVYKLNVWTLTINYVDEDGNKLDTGTTANPYTGQFGYNKGYSVASPEITGYHLVDAGQATVSDNMPNNDYEINVVYARNAHTVTWNLDGGKIGDDAGPIVQNKLFGDAITAPGVPVKEGYTFNEWTPDVASTVADQNYTYTATYTANEHNVIVVTKYSDNSVPESSTSTPYAYGTAYTVDTPADVTGYTYSVDGSLTGTMPDEDVTVTITYTPNQHNVIVVTKYADNSVPESSTSTPYAYGTSYTVDTPADVTGYTYTVDGSLTGTMGDADVTVTITYTPNQHNVIVVTKYTDNSVPESSTSTPYAYGTSYTVDTPADVTGYTYSVEGSLTGTMPDEDVTVTITYTPNQHNVIVVTKYSDNSVPESSTSTPYNYGVDYTVPTPAEVPGYTYTVDGSLTGTMGDADVTVTITYTPKDYTITWNLDGGKVGDNAGPIVDTYAFGATNITEPVPTKEGYDFADWDAQVPATMPAENLTFTAQWTPKKYDATFKLEGGNIGGNTADVVTPTDYNSDITAPSDPVRDGYTFEGWTDVEGGRDPLTSLGKMDNVNGKTFYAIWTADNAAYYIEVYRMGTDGQYPTTYTSRDSGNGDTDEHVSADPADYAAEGFTFDDAAANVLEGDIPASGSLTLKLYYKRDQHNAVFMSDGSEFASTPYYYQQDIAKPATEPVKDHSHFIGWSATEGGTTPLDDDEFGKMGTSDVTFYAIFEVNTYDVIYKFDDAQSVNEAPIGTVENTHTFEEVAYGEALPTINNPVAAGGYSFAGWVWYKLDGSEAAHGRTAPNTEVPGDSIEYDGRTGTKIDKPTTVPEYDVLAVAYFKAPGKAVFYWGDGDSTHTIDGEIAGEDGEPIIAPANPQRDGYNFVGWYDDMENGVAAGNEVTDFGDFETGVTKEFTAKWEEIPAYANFYANEGTWSTGDEPMRIQGVHSQPISDPRSADSTLNRDGYMFVGWGNSADATTPVASLGNYDRNAEANFYAIWEKNQVTFDANGGKIDVVNPTTGEITQADTVPVTGYNTGDDITDQVNKPTRPGYTFDKWVDENGNEFDPTDMPGGDIGTVTAQWTPNGAQNINYYDDENNLIKAVPVPEGGETPELGKDNEGNTIDPSKPGKEFVEWVDDSGNPVILPDLMPGEPINVYAKYNVIDYTLTFDPNGGDWGNGDTAAKSETKNYGDTISKPADPAAPNENLYFAGWSTDGVNPVNVAATMPAKDLTYIAVWKEIGNKYTVTYKDSDGTTIEAKEAREGDPVPKIANPSKPGYIFTGWKWTDASGKEIDKPVLMPGENITATATYTPIRSSSTLVVVGTAGARDGSPGEYTGEYGGEYSGEYAAPGYSMKPHIDAARPAEKPAPENHGEAIPQTGSNETAAIFAVVSAAAAAAYVVFATKTKKKDEED